MPAVRAVAQMDNAVEKTLRDLTRALAVADKDVLKAFRLRAYGEIEQPLAERMKAATRARTKYPSSANTIRANKGRKLSISIGRGSSKDALRALGNEFGGQKRGPRLYVTHSRTRATRYIVRKRTTQQFWPHLGRVGYAGVPLMRAEGTNTAQKAIDIVMDELLKLPGAEEVRT